MGLPVVIPEEHTAIDPRKITRDSVAHAGRRMFAEIHVYVS